ncbi:MAG: hypothetical protein Kow0075_02090 [Salibacteraceae bacterium]
MSKFEAMINRCIILLLVVVSVGCSDGRTGSKKSGTGHDQSPLDSINQVILANPNNAELYFERARLHRNERRLAEAMADLGRAMKLDSSNTKYYLMLADLKLVSKQSRQSRDLLLKAVEIDPQNVDILARLGELYMIVGDADASFEYLNKALKADPYNSKVYMLKGFNYKYLGDTVRAMSSFQTAVELNPSDYDSYLQLGLLSSAQKPDLALDYYDNALRVRPTSLEALYAKALLLQSMGKPRAALKTYDQLLEIEPGYYDATFGKGFVYLEILQRYDSAEIAFSAAIESGPQYYPQAHYNLGLTFERRGDFRNAALCYKKALDIEPTYDLAARGLERILD